MHPILDAGKEESPATFLVPAVGTAGDITCMALNAHFLVLGTASGMILYYLCQEKALLNKFKHAGGSILQVYPQPSGTRLVCQAGTGCFAGSSADPAVIIPLACFMRVHTLALCVMKLSNQSDAVQFLDWQEQPEFSINPILVSLLLQAVV